MSVGTSGRTPAKHQVLNALIGQQAGALPHVHRALGVKGMMFVDATAGDASEPNSSPLLIQKHSAWVAAHGLQARGYLIEREPRTFSRLQVNLPPVSEYLRHWLADARSVIPTIDRAQMALVLIDDPNHSGASTLTDEVIGWAFVHPATTVFASIGANASGIARRNGHYPESLQRYLALLDAAESERIYCRQAVFCRLAGDSHRWGYLIVGSDRFAEDAATMLRRAMGVVTSQHGARTLYLHGEISVGFDAVRRALTSQHQSTQMPRAEGELELPLANDEEKP